MNTKKEIISFEIEYSPLDFSVYNDYAEPYKTQEMEMDIGSLADELVLKSTRIIYKTLEKKYTCKLKDGYGGSEATLNTPQRSES